MQVLKEGFPLATDTAVKHLHMYSMHIKFTKNDCYKPIRYSYIANWFMHARIRVYVAINIAMLHGGQPIIIHTMPLAISTI